MRQVFCRLPGQADSVERKSGNGTANSHKVLESSSAKTASQIAGSTFENPSLASSYSDQPTDFAWIVTASNRNLPRVSPNVGTTARPARVAYGVTRDLPILRLRAHPDRHSGNCSWCRLQLRWFAFCEDGSGVTGSVTANLRKSVDAQTVLFIHHDRVVM